MNRKVNGMQEINNKKYQLQANNSRSNKKQYKYNHNRASFRQNPEAYNKYTKQKLIKKAITLIAILLVLIIYNLIR
jgi:hypothetical protein